MSGKEKDEESPFRRSSKVQRSPARKEVSQDVTKLAPLESGEASSESDRTNRQQKKRKQISPDLTPRTSKSKKAPHNDSGSDMDVEDSDDEMCIRDRSSSLSLPG